MEKKGGGAPHFTFLDSYLLLLLPVPTRSCIVDASRSSFASFRFSAEFTSGRKLTMVVVVNLNTLCFLFFDFFSVLPLVRNNICCNYYCVSFAFYQIKTATIL